MNGEDGPMSTYKKVYQRTIARLLSHHVEQGIPADTDLWPTIQERLAQRSVMEEPPTRAMRATRPRFESRRTPQQRQAPSRKAGRWLQPSIGTFSILGLLLLAAVGWVAISGLS